MNAKNKNVKEQVKESWWQLIPILVAIVAVPLVVRFGIEATHLEQYAWFPEVAYYPDMFSCIKRDIIELLDVVLLAGLVYLAYKKAIPKNIALIPLGIYFVLIVLSSIVTINSDITWNGMQEMRESAFVLMGYCLIFLYTYAIVKTEKHVKIIMFAFFAAAAVICLIGVFQFFDINPIMTDFGKSLIFSQEYQDYAANLVQTNTEVSSTLFHPNYMGIYCCILIPIVSMLLFSIKQKHWMILAYVVLLGMAFVCVMGADSNTAMIILMPFFLFLFVFLLKKMQKGMLAVFAVLAVIFIGINIYQGENSLVMRVINKIFNEYKPNFELVIDDIVLGDEEFSVVYKGNELIGRYESTEDGGYAIKVEVDGEPVELIWPEGASGYCVDDSRFDGLCFKLRKENDVIKGYRVQVNDSKYPNAHYDIYYSEQDETYYCKNNYNRYMKIYKSETFYVPAFGILNGFTNRDFIWMKSIPILKNTILLGTGPDTYGLAFPQYDYISIGHGWQYNYLITKPHSIYLQIGIQTGVLSLLAYLALWGCYVVESFRIYRKSELNTFTERCGLAIFVASFCYMVAGIVCDSYLGVSIVYWTLLGLGFACNKMAKNSEAAIITLSEKSKEQKLYIALATVIVFLLITVGHLLMNQTNGEYRDGRATFSSNEIEMEHYLG